MRIGIDAMGGDQAPAVEVKGAVAARQVLAPGDRIVLVGREDAVRRELAGANGWEDYIDIVHTDQVIGMNEAPVTALRSKPRSSLAVMVQMHARGELDACISLGNTGAFVAAAQMRLRRLPNVHRPGIAVVSPTLHGPVALCDVGANVSCRPPHLHQYGVMASVYMRTICGVQSPRVGLLNVGSEEAKGNDLVKRTHELFRRDRHTNFIGNVEGRDLFSGACDVVVCDGFVGNVMLKLIEGMADGLVRALLGELNKSMPDSREAIEAAGQAIAVKYDYNEYGGAPLLGVNGICIICHGASDHRGVLNAVRVTRDYVQRQANQQITALLAGPDGDEG
jgi:glycerol-3-phosphate acyltransferase PlsX